MSTVANLLSSTTLTEDPSAFRPLDEHISDREIRVERVTQWVFKGIQASFLAITAGIAATFIGTSSLFIIGGSVLLGGLVALSDKNQIQKECQYVNQRANFITCLKPKKRRYYRMIDVANTLSVLAASALLVLAAKISVVAAAVICLLSTTYFVILGVKYYSFAIKRNSIA